MIWWGCWRGLQDGVCGRSCEEPPLNSLIARRIICQCCSQLALPHYLMWYFDLSQSGMVECACLLCKAVVNCVFGWPVCRRNIGVLSALVGEAQPTSLSTHTLTPHTHSHTLSQQPTSPAQLSPIHITICGFTSSKMPNKHYQALLTV